MEKIRWEKGLQALLRVSRSRGRRVKVAGKVGRPAARRVEHEALASALGNLARA
jgi:hypothetical protein